MNWGGLSHPGRRRKIDREWIDLTNDRKGTFLFMEKPSLMGQVYVCVGEGQGFGCGCLDVW